jgi:LysR family transcriptional activator of glutamate synthase operon
VELRQLVYFEAVVRCGGFTRAAEDLRIAQPAVSAQVKRLESELGVALLTRNTRRVTLTSAGELLLNRVRRILTEVDSARAELDELATLLRGHVTIGATAVLGDFNLPAALASFHAHYPGVALTLRSGLISSLLTALDTGAVDLVVGPIHDDLPSRFSAHRLVDEQLVLITPPGHPLAHQRVVALGQLRDEPFVCLPPESGLHGILVAAAAAEGFQPRVQFVTHNAGSVRELVSSGLGVAILAHSAAHTAGPPVTVHTLRPAIQHPPIGLIHSRDRRLSPAARTCRTHLRRLVAG